MKNTVSFFVAIFLSAGFVKGQNIALLKTDFKSPILYTDSLTVNQIKAGYFPVKISEIDTFHAAMEELYKLVSKRQRVKMQSFEFRSGGCVVKVERVPMDYGDRYKIDLFNQIGESAAVLNLSNGKTKNKHIATKLKKVTTYIENEKRFTVKPYTIAPKYYYLVVVTE